VRDNNDGTYTVRYFLPFTDTFRLDVSLYGERYCLHPPHTHRTRTTDVMVTTAMHTSAFNRRRSA
jgi:hypothetical protein